MHDVHMKCGCTIVIVQCKVVCFSEMLNVKAVVAAFNQEDGLILGSRGEPSCGPSFEALMHTVTVISVGPIMMVGWLVSMTMTASSTLTTRNKAPSFVG